MRIEKVQRERERERERENRRENVEKMNQNVEKVSEDVEKDKLNSANKRMRDQRSKRNVKSNSLYKDFIMQ